MARSSRDARARSSPPRGCSSLWAQGASSTTCYPSSAPVPHPRAEALLVEGPVGLALIWTVRLLAVIGGALVLSRRNSGGWLLAVWMVFHVGLSLFHSAALAAVHVGIFSALAYVLFRHQASSYFAPWRGRQARVKAVRWTRTQP